MHALKVFILNVIFCSTLFGTASTINAAAFLEVHESNDCSGCPSGNTLVGTKPAMPIIEQPAENQAVPTQPQAAAAPQPDVEYPDGVTDPESDKRADQAYLGELKQLVGTEIKSDLASPWRTILIGRKCINGQPVDGFQGEVIEYWTNLECPYCSNKPVLEIQNSTPNICIVVRHFPENDSAIEKSLIYEALSAQSLQAAQEFWSQMTPKPEAPNAPTSADTNKALEALMDKYRLNPDFFSSSTMQTATSFVNKDRMDGMNRISFTPTYVIDGIRLSGCDLNQREMTEILPMVQKAKAGDQNAIADLISFVVKEQSEE